MRKTPETQSEAPVESRIATVGRDLARAFSDVLDALPGSPHRPLGLARALGVNKVLSSRILKAAQQHDPLAVAHMIPGPEPLRRLLRAAEKKKVHSELIREAAAAVDRFERLIDKEAGDRNALDAIIGGWLPDAREQVEMIAKQSMFRGASHLLGTACDLVHCTFILYPVESPAKSSRQSETLAERADSVSITNARGLRRIRPGQIINYDTIHATVPLFTIAGKPVEGLQGLLLEKFCTQPLPRLEVSRFPDRVQYTLGGERVGLPSSVHLVHATLMFAQKELFRGPDEPPRRTMLGTGVGMPTKVLVFDVLLHEGIFAGQQPLLKLLRGTVGEGPPRPNDPGEDLNRIDHHESIQSLGKGLERMRSPDAPDYQEILRVICEHRGWDGSKLRGFRCRIDYPMYSSQVVMAFDLPARQHS